MSSSSCDVYTNRARHRPPQSADATFAAASFVLSTQKFMSRCVCVICILEVTVPLADNPNNPFLKGENRKRLIHFHVRCKCRKNAFPCQLDLINIANTGNKEFWTHSKSVFVLITCTARSFNEHQRIGNLKCVSHSCPLNAPTHSQSHH